MRGYSGRARAILRLVTKKGRDKRGPSENLVEGVGQITDPLRRPSPLGAALEARRSSCPDTILQ